MQQLPFNLQRIIDQLKEKETADAMKHRTAPHGPWVNPNDEIFGRIMDGLRKTPGVEIVHDPTRHRNTINKSFDQVANEWMLAYKTLFPKAGAAQCILKGFSELRELQFAHHSDSFDSELDQLKECVDVIMCMISYCAAKGFTVNQIKQAIAEKTVINLNREWIENADGTYSHKKS